MRSLSLLILLASTFYVFGITANAQGLNVWVDFTSDFHDGMNGGANGISDWIDEINQAARGANVANFDDDERFVIEENILGHLQSIYSDYNIRFLRGQPGGIHDALFMGRDNDHPDVTNDNRLGVARYDAGNLFTNTYSNVPSGNPLGVPRVSPANFGFIIERSDSRDTQIDEFSRSLAGVAAHELGHSFGLLHHHTYSDPRITPANYGNTNGAQSSYVMARGLTELEIQTIRMFSPFSKVMLDITGGARKGVFNGQDSISLVNAPVMSDRTEDLGLDAGDSLLSAQLLFFQQGESSGLDISFVEADLDGSSSDIDIFRLEINSLTTMSAHVYSERLNYGQIEFDPVLELLDSSGNILFANDDVYTDGDIFGSGVKQSDDAFLNNISLSTGTYYLRVTPATADVSDVPNIGDNYWLVTALNPQAVPEPSFIETFLFTLGIFIGRRVRRLPS